MRFSSAIDCAGSSRSIGIMPSVFITMPSTGSRKSSFFAAKRLWPGRYPSSAAMSK